MITWAIVIVVVVLVLFVFILLTMGESAVKMSASKANEDTESFSVLPTTLKGLLGSRKKPSYVPDGETYIQLDRGFDINLVGKPQVGEGIERVRTASYALKPKDFIGMAPIPKLLVEIGARVKAGDGLFFDKGNPEVIYAAPISGEVVAVNRAEKRSITEVVILADQGDIEYRSYQTPNLETASREALVEFLLESGAWPFIRQRPFDLVADHKCTPKAIFVSTFDTAPLAPNLNLVVEGKEAAFQKGLDVLAKLSGGKVHLGLSANGHKAPAKAFTEAKNVEKHWVSGAHPAGNVGVQIHHIDPINSGDAVWYLDVQGVILLGTLFLEGKLDTERVVALTGAEIDEPRYVRVHQGAQVEGLLAGMRPDFVEVEDYVWEEKEVPGKDGKPVKDKEKVFKKINRRVLRIISGDPLTGKQVERAGFVSFFDDQVTVVQEGDYYEILGWLIPQKGHPTISRTFPGGFAPSAEYVADTNTNGEKRAFVMSGEYESVLPMDIYPQYLFRAIETNDIEKMEGLGLLELSEEDVALCEYVCTSKQPIQKILRKGLETLRSQG